MALPIKETPILKGKDAARFIKQIHENETRPITEKEREDYRQARKVYEEMEARGMGDLP